MLTSLPASAPRYDYSEWVRVYARYLDEQLDVYVKTSFFQVEVPRRLDPKGPGCSLLRAALGRCFAASVARLAWSLRCLQALRDVAAAAWAAGASMQMASRILRAIRSAGPLWCATAVTLISVQLAVMLRSSSN